MEQKWHDGYSKSEVFLLPTILFVCIDIMYETLLILEPSCHFYSIWNLDLRYFWMEEVDFSSIVSDVSLIWIHNMSIKNFNSQLNFGRKIMYILELSNEIFLSHIVKSYILLRNQLHWKNLYVSYMIIAIVKKLFLSFQHLLSFSACVDLGVSKLTARN